MEIPDDLLCLFTGSIDAQRDSYVLEVPEHELTVGQLTEHSQYRIAVLPPAREPDVSQETETEPAQADQSADPPVQEGENRVVEIEALGDQGDGIARVDRGYVVIVPDTDERERVRVEITDVRENVAFATVVERLSYYE